MRTPVLLLLLTLAACGTAQQAVPPGDSASGDADPATARASEAIRRATGRATGRSTDLGGAEDGTGPDVATPWWTVTRALGDDHLETVERYIDTSQALRRKAEVDELVWKVLKRTAKEMETRQFAGVYEMLPSDPEPDGTKHLQVLGKREGDHYKVTLDREGGLETLGDYRTGASLRPLGDGAYQVGMGFWIHAGDIVPAQVASTVAGTFRWLERSTRLTPAPGTRFEGALRREDFGVLRGVAATLPTAFPFASELLHIRDVAWTDYRSGKAVTQVQLILEPNLEALGERYPTVREYLVAARTMRWSRVSLRDSRGRELANAVYDGPNLQMRLRYAHRDGKLLPLLGDSLEPGLDFEQRGTTKGQVVIDVRLSFWGLKVHLEDWAIPAEYVLDDRRMLGIYRVVNLPKTIAVKGRLLGVLPVWMVDALIPANLEQTIRGFLGRLIEGHGLQMQVGFERKAIYPPGGGTTSKVPSGYGPTLYGTRVSGELADNGFVKVHTKMVRERVVPRKKARSQIGEIYRTLTEKLRADLASYRAKQSR